MKDTALMGKLVRVKKELTRKWKEKRGTHGWVARWETIDVPPRAGWIVGVRWLQSGYCEGRCWTPLKEPATKCLLVAYWPSQNPVKVPFDGFDQGEGSLEPFSRSTTWSERDRNALRTEMTNWPRDEKGRWAKK